MTSNGKTLNYKVVDLIESYNFHIMFTSIRVQTNKLQNFENRMAAVSHGGRSRYSTPARGTVANAVGHGGHGGRCIVLQFFGRTPFFAKLSWKNVKKRKIDHWVRSFLSQLTPPALFVCGCWSLWSCCNGREHGRSSWNPIAAVKHVAGIVEELLCLRLVAPRTWKCHGTPNVSVEAPHRRPGKQSLSSRSLAFLRPASILSLCRPQHLLPTSCHYRRRGRQGSPIGGSREEQVAAPNEETTTVGLDPRHQYREERREPQPPSGTASLRNPSRRLLDSPSAEECVVGGRYGELPCREPAAAGERKRRIPSPALTPPPPRKGGAWGSPRRSLGTTPDVGSSTEGAERKERRGGGGFAAAGRGEGAMTVARGGGGVGERCGAEQREGEVAGVYAVADGGCAVAETCVSPSVNGLCRVGPAPSGGAFSAPAVRPP
jgi:hypothetical protein